MGVKSGFLNIIITAVCMAVAWAISEIGVLKSVSNNFLGKIVICLFVVVIGKVITYVLGGK